MIDTDPTRPKQRGGLSDSDIEGLLEGMIAIAQELNSNSEGVDDGDLSRLPLDEQIEVLRRSIKGGDERQAAFAHFKVNRLMFFRHFFEADDHYAKNGVDGLVLYAYGAGLLCGRREATAAASALVAAENLRRRRLDAATRAAGSRGDPVRQAAMADIQANPKTTQTACARRVAAGLGKDQRSVEKIIACLFEWRELPGGGREKRPIANAGAPASVGLTG